MKLEDFIKGASKKRRGLNRKLLRAVANRLRNLRHEKHYNQDQWVEKNECGTACCVAGWTLIEAGATKDQIVRIDKQYTEGFWNDEDVPGVGSLAASLLGLPQREADALFERHGDYWPDEYRVRFHEATNRLSNERPSQVAADLLDAIAAGKVRL